MFDTEITVQVFENIETARKKLKENGFTLTDKITGTDSYYSNVKNNDKLIPYKKLIKNNIIIRSIFDTQTNTFDNKIVYKNKVIEKNIVISENKISSKIDNVENCKKIFDSIGLYNWVNLKQTNYFYKKGEIQITIGTVEGIENSILEIEEFPSIKDLTEKQKINKLRAIAKSLNLKLGNDFSIKKSYMLYKLYNKKMH